MVSFKDAREALETLFMGDAAELVLEAAFLTLDEFIDQQEEAHANRIQQRFDELTAKRIPHLLNNKP